MSRDILGHHDIFSNAQRNYQKYLKLDEEYSQTNIWSEVLIIIFFFWKREEISRNYLETVRDDLKQRNWYKSSYKWK